ncbi:sulfatase [Candidatus Latescibacterota bacterium]
MPKKEHLTDKAHPHNPHRRTFLKKTGAGTLGLAMAAGCGESKAPIEKKRPNIVFIFSDDHADRAMSCYGSVINKTPHLDRIANEGMRFDHAYITMSLCSPSRASILTGTYPHINGQVSIPILFDGSQTTFPQLLQGAGYQTAIVGKWHLHTEPTGFDYWNILIGQGPYFNPPMVENGVYRTYEGYTTDIIADKSIEWLENRDKTKPFCFMCNHKAPHWISTPDEKHAHMYDDTVFPYPETFDDDQPRLYDEQQDWDIATLHERYKNNRRWKNLPEGLSPQERKKDNYQRAIRDILGTIASLDDNIGRLLDYLEENNLAENTIVVYASDNGYYMGEHGWIDKKSPYDESLRIPLLVRYPGHIRAGSVNDDFVLSLDIGPTLLDYAGVEIPAEMQAESFRPLLEEKTPPDWRDTVYFQYHTRRRYAYYGIRNTSYKLIHYYSDMDEWEFYDLEKDPSELTNAAADPAYSDVIAGLKTELADIRDYYGASDELDQQIIAESESGVWRKELNEYMAKKMEEWKSES